MRILATYLLLAIFPIIEMLAELERLDKEADDEIGNAHSGTDVEETNDEEDSNDAAGPATNDDTNLSPDDTEVTRDRIDQLQDDDSASRGELDQDEDNKAEDSEPEETRKYHNSIIWLQKCVMISAAYFLF